MLSSTPPPVILGDPYWDNVVSLLRFDGDLTDETGRVWGVHGNPNTYTDGTMGKEITMNAGNYIYTNMTIGDEPITIEFFATLMSNANSGYTVGLIEWGTAKDGNDGFNLTYPLGQQAQNYIRYQKDYSHGVRNSPQGWSAYNKTHFAFVFDGINYYLYVDGFGRLLDTPNNANSTRRLAIGVSAHSWVQTRDIKFDELRITKGIARYTEDFDPPTEPFPNFGV